MQKLIAVLIMISFILPVPIYSNSEAAPPALDLQYKDPEAYVSFDKVKFAALDSADFIPVERKLIEDQKSSHEKKTTWYWWALGILVVGGIATAAGGGGGGGGSAPGSPTGSTTISW